MDTTVIILIILAILGAAIYFYMKRGGETSRERPLRAECRRSLNMPAKEADEIIDRQLHRLREKHPGKSEDWYLDKCLYDLQRDRN